MLRTVLAMALVPATLQAGDRIRLQILVGSDRHSRVIRELWSRQDEQTEKAKRWCAVLEKDLEYINRHFDVEFVNTFGHPLGGVPDVPCYRMDAENWQRFEITVDGEPVPERLLFCPCGMFVRSLRYLCEKYRYPLSEEYVQYQRDVEDYEWRGYEYLLDPPRGPLRPDNPFDGREPSADPKARRSTWRNH